jgi:hypothetical protein
MSGLSELPYNLTAQADNGQFAMAMGISPGGPPVTLTLRPGGRLRLKVVGEDGAPVAGASAYVSQVQGLPVSAGFGFMRTDPTGQMEAPAPAGRIEVTASEGKRSGKVTVSVPAAGLASAEVMLKAMSAP